ncbi:MAG: PAS domain S-box protein [Candidatus Rokubacteria bacterium]|nr:PAS domain S-box protein [Candidatus Rokubacteria bacterium]
MGEEDRQRLTLVQRFGLLSLPWVIGLTIALCGIAAALLTDQIVRHEAIDLGEMLQVLIPRVLDPEAFDKPPGTAPGIARAFEELAPSRSIVRVIVYDRRGRVLWSDDKTLIGGEYPDNPKLQAALRGRLDASIIHPGTSAEPHHAALRGSDRLLEMYVPVRFGRNAPIVGAVELYRDAPGVLVLLDRSVGILWVLGGLAGAALYVILVVIVRRASARQLALEGQLRAHARDLEERVAERTAALRETGARLENVLESSADAIVTLDQRGVIAFANRAAVRIFGYSQDALVGTRPATYWLHGRRDFRALRRALVRNERVENHETELRAADGRTVIVDVSASLLRCPRRGVTGAVGVLRDVTELRALHEQMLRTERLATAGLLAAGVAHEVGNPLMCISSVAQVLKKQSTVPAVQRGVDEIQRHVQRIARIVRDVSRVARSSRLQLRTVAVEDVLRTAVDLARHVPGARAISIDVECETGMPRLRGDPDRLAQVFLNLILNAVDAGANLTVRATARDGDVRVVFTDKGPGIGPETLARVFDPFFSTKADGHAGLGLFVSRETIREHGGLLLVESRPGHGSTFTVQLPVDRITEKAEWRE